MHPADANYGLRCPWLASGWYVHCWNYRRFPRADESRHHCLLGVCGRPRPSFSCVGECCLKLLFDQNLSRKLVSRLADVFPDSSHVQFHDLAEETDTKIWEFAKLNDFCIVTQDADFPERSRLYGSPPKVVWLRCGNASTDRVESLLRSGATAIQELLTDTELHCLELH